MLILLNCLNVQVRYEVYEYYNEIISYIKCIIGIMR